MQKLKKFSPEAGIEPATYSLEGCRATNCATRANYDIYK